MAPAKTKAVSLPQNREQASAALAEYAALDRTVDQLEILMNEQIAAIKADYFQKALPFRTRSEALASALQSYCEANRDQLTDNRSSKTVDFGVGKASWRNTLATVAISGKEKDLVDYIQQSADEELKPFLRATFELNRVALLRNPNLAKSIPGIDIVEAGETFAIKPDTAKIPEAAPAEAAA
jgi:phage host-nuclease inhibitor protein Gam